MDNPGNSVSHFAAIRMILTGNGSLLMKTYSLDDVRSKTLVPFTMASTIRILPTRLVNFMEQYAVFELKTTNIDEVFRITRIVIYTKEVFTSYPGN